MDIHGCPWKTRDIHGYPYISTHFHGCPWISMDIGQRPVAKRGPAISAPSQAAHLGVVDLNPLQQRSMRDFQQRPPQADSAARRPARVKSNTVFLLRCSILRFLYVYYECLLVIDKPWKKTEIGCMCNSRGCTHSQMDATFFFHFFPLRGCNYQFNFSFSYLLILLKITTRSVWPDCRGGRAGRPARPQLTVPRQCGQTAVWPQRLPRQCG